MIIIDLPNLTSFYAGGHSFGNVTSVTITSMLLINRIIVDLPKLTSFRAKYFSFYNTTTLIMSGIPTK